MVEIRALRPDDDRARFRSGNPDLDRFFLRFAGQNQFRHHLGVTYVASEAGPILGFVTVSATQLEAGDLPEGVGRNLPRYPLPALRLSRLAVAEDATGRGIGIALLRFVFQLAHDMAGQLGCVGVVVDAKSAAVSFYGRLGFSELKITSGQLGDRPVATPMFLPLSRIPQQTGPS